MNDVMIKNATRLGLGVLVVVVIIGVVGLIRSYTNQSKDFITATPINIGGLYLGMSREKALEICDQLLPKDMRREDNDTRIGCSGAWIEFDNRQRIKSIYFTEDHVNRIFKANNISHEEFRKQFLQRYNISLNSFQTIWYRKCKWLEYVCPARDYALSFCSENKAILLENIDVARHFLPW
jgi:hypothetical protein